MAKRIVLGPKDTLSKLAKMCYGDARLAKALAHYNGIRDARTVVRGQMIEVPAKRHLIGPKVTARGPGLNPPNGLDEILATFGDIYKYLRTDGTIDAKWESQMASAQLPFSIPLDWDTSTKATRMRVHKLLVPVIQDAFKAVRDQGLEGTVKTYGGGYSFRAKRTSAKLSTHSWGIAIDLNVRTNALGSAGDMDPRLVDLLRSFGFKWGGDWTGGGKDPMHFQFCTGY